MRRQVKRLRDHITYGALRVLLAGARVVPLTVLRGAGFLVGRTALHLGRRDRGRALANLEAAFPERNSEWRNELARRCAGHLGVLLGEVAWLWSATPTAILARSEFEGLEHLTGHLAPNHGAILVTGHCGNWEWLNLALGATGVPMTVAAREVYDPRLDEIARRLRCRFGGETALRGQDAAGKLVRALRRGRVMGLLIDQDIDAPGVFVEFFGRPAWTPHGAALMALRTGHPVVPGFAARLPNGRMRLSFSPPIRFTPGPDREADAARLTAILTRHIEEAVRKHPEQWVWMHRRWKHQPGEGETVWRPPDIPAATPSAPQSVG